MPDLRRKALATTALFACIAAALASLPAAATPEATPSLPVTVDDVLDLAGIASMPDGAGLILHADYPAEHPLTVQGSPVTALTVEVTPEGDVATLNLVSEDAATDGTAVRTGPSLDECSDPTFTPTGVRWGSGKMPIGWFLRFKSIPKGVGKFSTQKSLRKAHQVWPRQITRCGGAEPNTFRFRYRGKTPQKSVYDGLNVVDFGPLDGPLALSYTWYRGGRIEEVDLRFNSHYRWSNRADVGSAYQIVNVATHEIGHELGLDDLSGPHDTLTMFGVIGKGELRKTTLGRGDMKGASTLSP